MKFVTNRIRTGKVKSFDDIVNEYRKAKEVKTASTETVVKTAEKDEGCSSGQLDVEPLHQTGESTTMPKNGPNAKKEGTEKGTAKANTDPEAEGKDSGQPKAEGSEKFTNEPKVEEDAKGGSVKEETKIAEAKCEECKKVCAECICSKCECKACKAAKEEKIKVATELTPAQEKLPDFIKEKIEGKDNDDDKDDKDEDKDGDKDGDKDDKEAKVEKDDKEEKEAKTEDKEDEDKEAEVDKEEKKEEKKEATNKKQFVKIASLDGENLVKTMICLANQAVKSVGKEAASHYLNSLFGELKFANLNAKNKEFLRTYWTKLFGEDYVNVLLADK